MKTKQSQRAKDRARQAAINGKKKPRVVPIQQLVQVQAQKLMADAMLAESLKQESVGYSDD